MTRPASRAELLAAAPAEFARLWDAVELVPLELRERPGACGAWSVKDVLAHLHAWHVLTLGWERAGSAGEAPMIPGSGYSWAQIPALNHALFERARSDPWDDVVERLNGSHDRVIAVIESCTDDDLFTRRRFEWTGSTSVGSYLVSASSSHYAWATTLIRRWARLNAPPA